MVTYCHDCEQRVETEKGFNLAAFLFFTIGGIGVGGIVYLIYVAAKSRTCQVCGGTNFGRPPEDSTDQTKEVQTDDSLFRLCPICDKENPETFHFCSSCGKELKPNSCPNCDTDTHFRTEFCPNCGTKQGLNELDPDFLRPVSLDETKIRSAPSKPNPRLKTNYKGEGEYACVSCQTKFDHVVNEACPNCFHPISDIQNIDKEDRVSPAEVGTLVNLSSPIVCEYCEKSVAMITLEDGLCEVCGTQMFAPESIPTHVESNISQEDEKAQTQQIEGDPTTEQPVHQEQ
jgi:predicted amidophosphoribosyltransferase